MSPCSGKQDSVFDEPHLRPASPAVATPNEAPLDSVFLEPGREGISTPYRDWLQVQLSRFTPGQSWILTLWLSLLAGPLALFAAFWNQSSESQLLLIVIVGPLVEEMGKIIVPLMVVERNPARFTSHLQPVICAVVGGLVFSIIENILYLKVYVEDPSALLITWRWTVCVMLHTGCSFVAGCGVAKIRRQSLETLQPPRLETGAFLILAAVVIHAVYNFLAILITPLF